MYTAQLHAQLRVTRARTHIHTWARTNPPTRAHTCAQSRPSGHSLACGHALANAHGTVARMPLPTAGGHGGYDLPAWLQFLVTLGIGNTPWSGEAPRGGGAFCARSWAQVIIICTRAGIMAVERSQAHVETNSLVWCVTVPPPAASSKTHYIHQ